MQLSSPSLDVVDARYRALADVAGSLASHRDLNELLLSLRGQVEPLVEFTFLVV